MPASFLPASLNSMLLWSSLKDALNRVTGLEPSLDVLSRNAKFPFRGMNSVMSGISHNTFFLPFSVLALNALASCGTAVTRRRSIGSRGLADIRPVSLVLFGRLILACSFPRPSNGFFYQLLALLPWLKGSVFCRTYVAEIV